MKRRDFFKQGLQKVVQAVVETADRHAEQQAVRWLRPPFALRELDFLLACTRCDLCIKACRPAILFPLPVRMGPQAAGTPAMDLSQRGCTLCEGWPCVAVCEPGALKLPVAAEEEGDPPPRPRLATVVIDSTTCLPFSGPECGACGPVCPVPGALLWHDGRLPHINPEQCTGCALCREACITQPKAIQVRSLAAGWESKP